MATDRLSLRLPEPLRLGIESLCELTGRNESDLVREAIEEYLARSATLPTCYDLAKKTGVIGCVNSGKADLSTNPKHMDGFGK
ncbi:MAG: ribbon-helix-helix domain-containing protein [Pirellula sp.]